MNVAQMTHHIIFCYILTFQGSENDDSKDGRNEMNFKVGMLNTWKSWIKLMLPYLTEVQVYCWGYILHVCHMLFFEWFLKMIGKTDSILDILGSPVGPLGAVSIKPH